MPRQTYKILNFHGGLNNDADPRDIRDDQFAVLQNVAIDKVGKIVALGDIKTIHHTMAGAITTPGGRGLMALRTDYDGFADGTVGVGGGTYYVVENGAALNTESGADVDDAEAETAITVGNLAEASMYYVDGALRVYDADHAASVTPQWRGFIRAKTYMPDNTSTDQAIPAQWYTGNAQIAGAFSTFSSVGVDYCHNAIMANSQDATGVEVGFNLEASVCTVYSGSGVANSAAATSPYDWGLWLAFDEGANDSGTWMPSTTTRYKFYVTTMYDDHAQESLPQLFRMFGTRVTLTTSGNVTHAAKNAESEIYFTNGNTNTDGGTGNAEAGNNVAVWFKPIIKISASGTNSTYNFGAVDLNGDGTSGGDDNGNPRISGVRIYWASNEDGYSSLWQMFDMKFDEGARIIGVDGGGGGILGYSPMVAELYDGASTGTYSAPSLSADNKWSDPPKYAVYSEINGHEATEVINVDSFKTSVIANRRAYIGHIEQDGQIHGDRILKSPVNQFDKFPQDTGQLDVVVHDGDEIVQLAEFADRILQFKKSILYIINVSGAAEYLESEHKFKGVTNPGAVSKTDYGIAWANQNGCYLYDGQNVTDLLEDGGIRKISKDTWSNHIGTANYHRVGYNPKKRQIIVIAGAADSSAGYVFDLVTKGWVYGSAIIVDPNTGSNFINDPVGGDLLIFDEAGGTIDKWADTPTAAPSIIITTKDIDFGEPGINKNVYKVRITYTGGTSQACNIEYAKDGSGTFLEFNADLNYTTNTTQQVVDLTPSAAINDIKSIQLKISGTAATTFELNDISIIYRRKGIR